MVIICLSGKAGAGKDTAADVLVKRYAFRKMSFADPLRDLCSRVFGLHMSNFLDRNLKDKEFDTPIVFVSFFKPRLNLICTVVKLEVIMVANFSYRVCIVLCLLPPKAEPFVFDTYSIIKELALGSLFSTSAVKTPRQRVRMALEAAAKFNMAVRPPFTIIEV